MEIKLPFRYIVAVAIVAAFFAFTYYVAAEGLEVEDEKWIRLYSIFSSVEALGFAAAGLILGRTIETPQVNQLRTLETQNATLAAQKQQDAATLQTLQQELQTARTALASAPGSEAETREIDKTLERALMRIDTTKTPASDDKPA